MGMGSLWHGVFVENLKTHRACWILFRKSISFIVKQPSTMNMYISYFHTPYHTGLYICRFHETPTVDGSEILHQRRTGRLSHSLQGFSTIPQVVGLGISEPSTVRNLRSGGVTLGFTPLSRRFPWWHDEVATLVAHEEEVGPPMLMLQRSGWGFSEDGQE